MSGGVVTTVYARTNQARAQAGLEPLKVVTHMAIGSGGHGATGVALKPNTQDTALGNELLSLPVTVTFPIATTGRYTVRLDDTQLNGFNISELGLKDADGNLLARKTFTPQPKTDDVEFTFDWDEIW
jgi:phage-related tail fiber protein